MPDAPQVEWTTEWPTGPGWYWFYGVWRVVGECRPSLRLVHADDTFERLYLHSDRVTLYKGHVGPHRWAKATLPEPPDLESEP